MPFNGSGTFVRVYDWEDDAAAGINIRADRMDGEDNGFATGLSTTICRDGQSTIIANLPMNNFRHTGVGNAQARTDYAAAGQVQDGGLVWGSNAAGTANAITTSLTPALTSYTAGLAFQFKATADNTGATTVNVNGLGTKTIKKNVSDDLDAYDIKNGQVVRIVYDGTNFQLQGVPAVTGFYLKQIVYNAQYFS